MICRIGSSITYLVNYANYEVISKLMLNSSNKSAVFKAATPIVKFKYDSKPIDFKEKYDEILKKEKYGSDFQT